MKMTTNIKTSSNNRTRKHCPTADNNHKQKKEKRKKTRTNNWTRKKEKERRAHDAADLALLCPERSPASVHALHCILFPLCSLLRQDRFRPCVGRARDTNTIRLRSRNFETLHDVMAKEAFSAASRVAHLASDSKLASSILTFVHRLRLHPRSLILLSVAP